MKTMICVWWDWEDLIHWEMLGKNTTVEKILYKAQSHRVNEAIQQKRPDRQGQVILLHDNARPHTAKTVKMALQELGWEVLQHPPYSPDLAPTDYHLFRCLSNEMRGLGFENQDHLENWLNNFFKTRSKDFWQNGINIWGRHQALQVDIFGSFCLSEKHQFSHYMEQGVATQLSQGKIFCVLKKTSSRKGPFS